MRTLGLVDDKERQQVEEHAAAYQELHMDAAVEGEQEEPTLGMITVDGAGEAITFDHA